MLVLERAWELRFSVGVWRLHDGTSIERFKGQRRRTYRLAAYCTRRHAALVILVSAVGSIVLWRAYMAHRPNRIASRLPQLQARTAQAFRAADRETRHKNVQQESIDQLQLSRISCRP